MFLTKIAHRQTILLDRPQPLQFSEYEGYLCAADEAFRNGRVAATQKGREMFWKNGCLFVRPLAVEPWLQDATYQQRVRCLIGFPSCVLSGCYGRCKQFEIGTVSGALSAVGKTVALVYEGSPIKTQGDKALLTRLSQTIEGWKKEDTPTRKKFSWELMYQKF